VPTQDCIKRLEAKNAIMRLKCSLLDLYSGKWKIVGKISDWKRENWPLPVFFRDDLLAGTVLIRFSDENLVSPIEEITYGGGDILLADRDRTSGSGAVAVRLRQKLNISE
jgi:hypothetical protein